MKISRLLLTGLLLAPLLSQPASAQVLDPTFTSPTGLYSPGAVYALGPQQADGKRLVAGTFTRVNGTDLRGLVRLDAAGVLDQAFSQNVGSASNVYRIRALPSGQYLLGSYGGSVTAGGISRRELLRLNANGSADASFDAGSGPSGGGYVQEYAVQPDGKVVVTGTFTNFSGVPAAGVARLNANGSVDTGFSVGTGFDANSTTAYNAGYTVAVQADGKIVVGGEFNTFNGITVNGLVRLNPNGFVDPTFNSPLQPGSYVESVVVQPDGKILASGSLATGVSSFEGLVRLLPSGTRDVGFSAASFTANAVSTSQFDAPIVLQPDGKILVVGYFNQPGAAYVARLNANGSQDASFQVNNGPSSIPYTIGLQANGSVLVGGAFAAFNGTELTLGQLSSTGSADAAFTPKLQIPGNVMAMVRQNDGKLIIGGSFTEINGQPAHRLARLTAAGALDAGYMAATSTLPGPITCLALQPDGNALAGTNRGMFRFSTAGNKDLSFNIFQPLSTSTLAMQPDGRILLGGAFGFMANGISYSGLVRLNTNGTHDQSFVRPIAANTGPGAPGTTDAVLVQPDGRIVVGGNFRPSGQSQVGRVVRYLTTGALDPTFNNASTFTNVNGTSNPQNRIYSLALQPDGKILAGGNFGAVDGTLHYGVVRLGTTGQPDPGFSPDALLTGTVFTVALQPNGRVLLGGQFSNSAASSNLSNLARFLDNGQTDVSFRNSAMPGGTVRSLLVQPDGAIALAGLFATVGGQLAQSVARITAPNVLHVAAPAAVAARTAVWPVPAHGLLHVAPDASAHPRTVELLDALGRPVRSEPVTNAAELTLDVENLPAGLYLLRVTYAAGTVTRRLAVN